MYTRRFASSGEMSSAVEPTGFELPAYPTQSSDSSSYKASAFESPTAYDVADFPADADVPAFAPEDFDAAQNISGDVAPYGAEESLAPPADFETAPTRSASTRELIAAARAAAVGSRRYSAGAGFAPGKSLRGFAPFCFTPPSQCQWLAFSPRRSR